MCAYGVGIAAPAARFLDHAVLRSQRRGVTVMDGLLSDAVLSYNALLRAFGKRSPARRTLIVTNSWGMYSPDWDFPVGDPGNYSDNPSHPFNIIVETLANAGADILFAAGNCGHDCPDIRCQFGSAPPICGANSHPSVLCVAGVDTTDTRVGYSSQGPGRLHQEKPDIAAYTHFNGSGVYSVDAGTSAACPVAAGVIAAIRSVYPPAQLPPAQLQGLLRATANNKGKVGFNSDYGWGIINVQGLLGALP